MQLTQKQTLGLLALRQLGTLEVAKCLYDIAGEEGEEAVDAVLQYVENLETDIDENDGADGIDENEDPIGVVELPGRPPLFTNPRPSHVA